jgi:type IV pilus assembly protein PilC
MDNTEYNSNLPQPEKHRFVCRVRSKQNILKTEMVTVEALDREEVIAQLQDRNYVVVSISESSGGVGEQSEGLSSGAFSFKDLFSGFGIGGAKQKDKKKRSLSDQKKEQPPSFLLFPSINSRELINFAVQLAALLEAGIPLIRSLQIVQKGVRNGYFQNILKGCIDNVSQGFTFGVALSKYSKVFPTVWTSLVEVGETSGRLAEVLKEIAHYQEAEARIKGKVISALFYPAVLLFFALCAVTFLMLKIIPKFETIFQGFRIQMPAITVAVITVSKILRNYFPFVVGGVVVLILLIGYLSRLKKGRYVLDLIKLKAPIFGGLALQVSIIRFTRSLATLVKAGIPILKGLEISIKLVQNSVIQEMLIKTREGVQVGHTLGSQLEQKRCFPVFMTQLISVGEEAGELERFLNIVANYYEERVDTFLARLSTLIEPVLLVLMGGMIGTIVIAMFLPIIEISTGGR